MNKKNTIATATSKLRGAAARAKKPSSVRWELATQQQSLPLSQYPALLDIFTRVAPAAAKRLLPSKRNDYRQVLEIGLTAPIEAEKELRWAASVLSRNAPLLNLFAAQKSQLEAMILAGEYDEARELLAEMNRDHGYSIWASELETALIQQMLGLQEHKRFISSITSQTGPTLFSSIMSFVSERNEDQTTVDGFMRHFTQKISGWNLPGFLHIYFFFRVLGVSPGDDEDVSAILGIDKYASLPDYYETFMSALIAVSTRPDQFPACADSVPAILRLTVNISDPRLARIRSLYQELDDLKVNPAVENFESFTDAYSIYSSAIEVTKGRMSTAVNRSDSISSELIQDISAVLLRVQDRHHAWISAFKRVLNLRGLNACAPLGDLLLRKTTRFYSQYLFPASFALSGPAGAPITLTGLANQIRTNRLTQIAFSSGTAGAEASLLLELQTNPTVALTSGSDYLRAEAMFQALRLKEFPLAAQLAAILAASENPDIMWEAKRVSIEVAALRGELSTSIARTASICVDDPMLAEELPLELLFKGKKWRDLREAKPLELAIGLYIYCENSRDSNAEFNLKQCVVTLYEDGTRSQLLQKASEGQSLTRAELFILRDVFVEDYLGLVREFHSSQDIDRERLSICQALLNADRDNAAKYEQQIRTLSFKSALNDGMQQIDQTRIYVDYEGIRRWAEKDLKETFNRWVELSAIDTSPSFDVQEVLSKIFDKPKEIPPELLVTPSSQADQLLVQILVALLNRFLNDPQDGLNSYLSLRVRHGTLDGILRAPFKEEGLLTEIDANTKKPVLAQGLAELVPSQCSSLADLESALSHFTMSFNQCLDTFIKNELRIKSDAYPGGLIDINVNAYMFNLVKADLLTNKSFDALLGYAFQQFAIRVRSSMLSIHARLKGQVYESVESAGLALRTAIGRLTERDSLSFVTDRLGRANIAFQGAIIRAIEWFQFKPGESFARTFVVEEIVKIAVQMTKNLCPGFNPVLSIHVEDNFPAFSGSTLITVSDAIFIMLDNVFKHSGKVNGEVSLQVRNGGGNFIEFSVVGDVDASVLTPEAVQRVQSIEEMLERGEHLDLLSTEGGTGLIKLSRLSLLNGQDQLPRPLTFGFIEGPKFFTSVKVPFRTVSIDVEEQNEGAIS